MNIPSILSSPLLWGALLALGLFAWGTVRSFVKGIPIVNKRSSYLFITAVVLLLVSGMLQGFSLGSLTGASAAVTGWSVSDVKLSNLGTNVVGGTIAVDSTDAKLVNLRMTDAQANETTSNFEVNTSIFTVTRSGELPADSCIITVTTQDYSISQVTGAQSATPYNILEKDVDGKVQAYLKSGTVQASSSDYQVTMPLAFTEGSASAQFTLTAEIDEESHDALLQYNSKDIQVDVCGTPVVIRAFRMD
jgi:hypothetical protein